MMLRRGVRAARILLAEAARLRVPKPRIPGVPGRALTYCSGFQFSTTPAETSLPEIEERVLNVIKKAEKCKKDKLTKAATF